MGILARMLAWLDRLVGAFAALIVVIVTLAVTANVFFRYVLESGIVWADEIPGLLLVWIAFLGAYLAYRRDGHIAFDLLVTYLPPRVRPWVETLADGLVLGLAVLMVHLSWRMIARVGRREIETLEIAQGWFMAILPIAFALIALALVVRIVERHTAVRLTPPSTPVEDPA